MALKHHALSSPRYMLPNLNLLGVSLLLRGRLSCVAQMHTCPSHVTACASEGASGCFRHVDMSLGIHTFGKGVQKPLYASQCRTRHVRVSSCMFLYITLYELVGTQTGIHSPSWCAWQYTRVNLWCPCDRLMPYKTASPN